MNLTRLLSLLALLLLAIPVCLCVCAYVWVIYSHVCNCSICVYAQVVHFFVYVCCLFRFFGYPLFYLCLLFISISELLASLSAFVVSMPVLGLLVLPSLSVIYVLMLKSSILLSASALSMPVPGCSMFLSASAVFMFDLRLLAFLSAFTISMAVLKLSASIFLFFYCKSKLKS